MSLAGAECRTGRNRNRPHSARIGASHGTSHVSGSAGLSVWSFPVLLLDGRCVLPGCWIHGCGPYSVFCTRCLCGVGDSVGEMVEAKDGIETLNGKPVTAPSCLEVELTNG